MRVQRRILAVEVAWVVGGWNRLGRNGYLHIWTNYFHQTFECCNNFWDLMTLKLVRFFIVCFSMRDAVYFTNMHHFQNWPRDIVEWGGKGTKHGCIVYIVETFEKVLVPFLESTREKLGPPIGSLEVHGILDLSTIPAPGRSSICTRAPKGACWNPSFFGKRCHGKRWETPPFGGYMVVESDGRWQTPPLQTANWTLSQEGRVDEFPWIYCFTTWKLQVVYMAFSFGFVMLFRGCSDPPLKWSLSEYIERVRKNSHSSSVGFGFAHLVVSVLDL